MEATVIDFILSTLMSLSAQYPDAAWLVTALSVVMTVCGLCAVATAWMPVPKETEGLYAVFYRWAHALAAHFGQNKGVVEVGANSVIDAFRGLNAHILVQEYIKEAQGCDIRCLVVGDEVVAAIERRAKEGDFRSNLHRGGAASVASITPQEREIAIKAARTMALDVAGVDILRANRGPLVMEVNASPGLEGIEKTTGIDIAGKMIRWIERHATTEYCLKTGG